MVTLSTTSKRNLLGLAGLALALAPMGAAQAAPRTLAGTYISAGNWTGATSGKMGDIGPSDYRSSSAFIQGDMTTSPGNTITYSATAQSSLTGGLKAKASISGDGLTWDDSYSPFLAADGTMDPNGTAHWYEAVAFAELRDTLSVSGAQDLTSVAFQFHIDGNVFSDPNYEGQVTLHSGHQSIFHASSFNDWSGGFDAINQTVTSGLFNVVDGQVDFDFLLQTRATYGFNNYWTTLSGEFAAGDAYADFFNTVTIADIFGFNAAGQRVSLFSVAGSDGAVLPASQFTPVSAVPEPATWAMMIIGFGAVGSMVRTSRRRNDLLAA